MEPLDIVFLLNNNLIGFTQSARKHRIGRTHTITITGSRHQDTVKVTGTTTGLTGKQLRAMVRFPGQTAYSPGSTTSVSDSERFTWQRRTSKKTYVNLAHGDVTSNRVIIPARR